MKDQAARRHRRAAGFFEKHEFLQPHFLGATPEMEKEAVFDLIGIGLCGGNGGFFVFSFRSNRWQVFRAFGMQGRERNGEVDLQDISV